MRTLRQQGYFIEKVLDFRVRLCCYRRGTYGENAHSSADDAIACCGCSITRNRTSGQFSRLHSASRSLVYPCTSPDTGRLLTRLRSYSGFPSRKLGWADVSYRGRMDGRRFASVPRWAAHDRAAPEARTNSDQSIRPDQRCYSWFRLLSEKGIFFVPMSARRRYSPP